MSEIGQLQGLLRLWSHPLPGPAAGGGPGMRAAMGMASDAALAELSGLEGPAFDRLWLPVMTRHHQGAVAMARDVLARGESRSVENHAETVLGVQSRQIQTMSQIAATS